jgi:paraquat-inducible protein B
MSDQNGQEIGVNVYDDEDELIEDEEAAAPKPVEVVREEILTVTRNTDTEDNDIEDDLRELVKSHSDQISRLADMVESLQSQMKRIDQRRGSSNKTSSVKRNRTTTKTKKNKATSKKPKGKSSKRSNQF